MRTTLLISALLVAASGTAFAQLKPTLKVDIPFEFYAADRLMAAGVYLVSPASHTDRNVWVLRPNEDAGGVFVGTSHASDKTTSDQARLVFNKYTEDRIFLNQIVLDRSGYGHPTEFVISKTKKEREMVVSTLRAGLQPQKLFVLAMAR